MTSRPSRRTPLHLALCALLVVSITAVACNTDVPTAAQIEAADVDAMTQTLGVSSSPDRTVFLVDGTPTLAEEARALRPEEIASIDVRGTNDPQVTEVRIVTGKRIVVEKRIAGPDVIVEEPTVRLRGDVSPDAQPLVVLDGVLVRSRSADVLRDLKLNPDRIESIEVIKGPSAVTAYGDAGRNGVIVITSKKQF